MISLYNKIFVFEILMILFQANIFSEIYIQNMELKDHIIVSLTTSKEKMENLLIDHLVKSLLNQTVAPYKILLCINKDDITYMSEFLKILIENNIIELIFISQDFKYFNKYYYIPEIYKKYIIITFDDNTILEKNSIKKLFKSYKIFPEAISARRVYKMKYNKIWILEPFYCWDKNYKEEKSPKFSLFAIHGEGALFPPNTLNFTDNFIFSFKNVIEAQDFIIKYFELSKNLKTVYVNDAIKDFPLDIKLYEKYNKLFTISPNEIQLLEDFGAKYNVSLYKNVKRKKVEISSKIKDYFLNTINNNKITNDTLLVSMTSYPARIYGIFKVFLSLLHQSANISSYQCFLTLAKEEFVNGENDLPSDTQTLISNGWIKLIWYHNIYSHKKLMPILQYYPENDILIVDDDIIRTYNFIETFQKDHRLYPTDILCGNFGYYFDNNIEIRRLIGYGRNIKQYNAVPNIIFQTARPSNGFGGVLYPKHTFSDKRFFNETLYMDLSPTSDESWQYTFNIIENKILRQTSIIIDNSKNFVHDSQKIETSLFRVNDKDKYSLINDKIINAFPEYKINSIERQKKIIISLTSSKKTLKKLHLVLESIFNNTMKPSKIVLTLYKKNEKFLTKYLADLVINKKLELIITDFDLKSHNKYFEVMKKYKDYAIITIDSDIIYPNDLIETLYNSYVKNPNCIHARFVHKIMTENNKVLPYNQWLKKYTFELNPSFFLFPITGGGALFPPNILNISDYNIDEIYKFIEVEDIYIKYLSRKRYIKIVWVPNNFSLGIKQIKTKKVQRSMFKSYIKLEKFIERYLKIFPIIY